MSDRLTDSESAAIADYRALLEEISVSRLQHGEKSGDMALLYLKLSRVIGNHGQLLNRELNIGNPVPLAIDYAAKALLICPDEDLIRKALADLEIANSKRLLNPAPYAQMAEHCQSASASLELWRQSMQHRSATNEDHEYVSVIELNALDNSAMYLHYANDFDAAISIFEYLLDSARFELSDEQRFSTIVKLANVLNDANRRQAARAYLYAQKTERLAITADQKLRLLSARSLCQALAGDMGAALEDISAALQHFNADNPETRGNLLIRAARYYCRVADYDKAQLYVSGLSGLERKHSGMDFGLNLALVRATIRVAAGTRQQAEARLAHLDAALVNTEDVPEDFLYSRTIIKTDFLQRFHDGAQASRYLADAVDPDSLAADCDSLLQFELLLKYGELLIQQNDSRLTIEHIQALLCGAALCDRWIRWRAASCAAHWYYRHSNAHLSVFWSKVACQQVLSLSVPLLQAVKQRKRMSEELLKPFQFLETALIENGDVSTAQKIHVFLNNLMVGLNSTTPAEGERFVVPNLETEVPLNSSEQQLYTEYRSAGAALVNLYEQGVDFQEAIQRSGILSVFKPAALQEVSTDILQQSPVQLLPPLRAEGLPAVNCLHLCYSIRAQSPVLRARNCIGEWSVPLAVTLTELRKTVYQYLLSLRQGEYSQSMASDFYRILIAPVEGALELAEKIVVSGVDILQLLPFHTLCDDHGPIANRYCVINAHSSRISSVKLSDEISDEPALMLGTRQHLVDDEPLCVDDELTSLQAHFGATTVLLDDAWTLEACKAQTHTIVHVCCHFEYLAQNPTQSVLLLSSGRRLSVAEFLQMQNWLTVKLLYLATCDSAVGAGTVEPTAMRSLADLFVNAGVERVVASYRPINDHWSAQFCQHFYAALQTGISVEAALQLAQRQALSDENPIWTAYGCWAY